jgi:PmbA protein
MPSGAEIAEDLLAKARRKGATAADLILAESEAFSVQVRLGEVDKVTHAQEKRLGLRVFFGHRSAVTSTSDLSQASLEKLLDETCMLSQATAVDEYAGLPSSEDCVKKIPDMDLWDPSIRSLSVERKINLAKETEKAALEYDPRIINSEGADFSHDEGRILYANNHGLIGEYAVSSHSLSVSPVAAEPSSGSLPAGHSGMQRDYWYSVQRKLSRLEPPVRIGQRAAQRTLRRLGAKKIATQQVPVIFESEMSASLLSSLFAAVSGSAIYKGASFLIGKLGHQIASPQVTVYDDGTIRGALGSKPFDAEGLPTRKTTVVEKGVLKSYLLDAYSSRKLGLNSTGNATRGVGDAPSVGPTNFYLAAGTASPEEIIHTVSRGLYVIELLGFGVNHVTGDYSRGAMGLWIENGELTYPVEEITIAGNLKEMLMNIEIVGNDLEFRGRVAAPTLMISQMTIAGN